MHLVIGHSLVAKTYVFSVGPEDEKPFVADGFENSFVESYGGFVVVRVDAHSGVIDHIGEKSTVQSVNKLVVLIFQIEY